MGFGTKLYTNNNQNICHYANNQHMPLCNFPAIRQPNHIPFQILFWLLLIYITHIRRFLYFMFVIKSNKNSQQNYVSLICKRGGKDEYFGHSPSLSRRSISLQVWSLQTKTSKPKLLKHLNSSPASRSVPLRTFIP